MHKKNKKMKTIKSLETILVLTGALIIFFLIYKINDLLYIALGLIIISILSKQLTYYISWIWLKLAEGMGFVVSKITLSIIYYVFLFPIALLSRLSNKNSLILKNKNKKTLYVDRNVKYSSKDLENIW